MGNKQEKTEQIKEQLEKDLKLINSTDHGRRAFIASLPVLMSACATVDQTRYREGDNTGQVTEMTVEDEVRMTQEVLPKMRQDYPPIPNSSAQSYLVNMGNRIVQKNNLASNPYKYSFTLVGVPGVNAFALPAGTVFVTAPLVAMADTEAELAGVVGHEVGHIQARHTAERMSVAKKSKKSGLLYGLGGAIAGAALGAGIGKLMCKQDRNCLARIAMYGAQAGGFGGLLISKYGFMANSREDEMEADRIGFKTATKAGYHKDEVGRFYEKLQQMEQKRQSSGGGNIAMGALADAMSTHPPSHQRIQQMQQMASETPTQTGVHRNPQSFQQFKAFCVNWTQRHQSKG